ncbi:MAG: hypothetical protein ACRC10_03660 [Thermoguttaceae bacterium]
MIRLSCVFIMLVFGLAFELLSERVASAESGPVRFRVDNEVRREGGTSFSNKTTTYFYEGVVYDVLAGNREITVFDEKSNSFSLLDPVLRLQTCLSASEIKTEVAQVQREMKKHANPFIAFAVDPKFEEKIDETTGVIQCLSPWIEYTINTKPLTDTGIGTTYFDFCNWICYFNLRVNPSAATSFARMQVNRLLQEKGRFPEQIKVNVYPKGHTGAAGIANTPDVYISTHHLVLRLVPADEQRIAEIRGYLDTFRKVSLSEYQQEVRKNQQTK